MMNTVNFNSIAEKYAQKFSEINNPTHREYYKWQIAYQYPDLFDDALASNDDELCSKLLNIKKLTENLIDNFTSPFYGLCKAAEREPGAVKRLFADLFSASDTDLQHKKQCILSFINDSNRLVKKYYPNSYRYKNDLHSATAFLFFYRPETNYLYKSTECNNFADIIGFLEPWGSTGEFDLRTFYRMCDMVVNEMKKNADLMKTDALRFDGRFGDHLHPDLHKHILLFDLIYCCTTYNLFEGLSFQKSSRFSSGKELKQNKQRALRAQQELESLESKINIIEGIKSSIECKFPVGKTIQHKSFGEITILENSEGNLKIRTSDGEEKRISAMISCLNGLVEVEDKNLLQSIDENKELLKMENSLVAKQNQYKKTYESLSIYLQ